MTERQFQILSDIQNHVSDIFLNKINKTTRFHTLLHTQEVVAACELMAEYYHLSDEDHFALIAAAWFHDTGYANGQAKDHETASIETATKFLQEQQVESAIVEKVTGCINATRLPQNPSQLIEQIICDADLFHLGSEDFKEKSRLLREELNDFGGLDFSKKDWRKTNIQFLENHKYFTSYAQTNKQPLKEVFLNELRERVQEEDGGKKNKKGEKKEPEKEKQKDKEKDKEKDKSKDKGLTEDEEKKLADIKKKKDKESQSERAIATVFRIMAQNQANLGQMADTKSNILISVSAIILSFVIGTLFDKMITDPNLQAPVILLVSVLVITIVFAILATRPTITGGTFTKEDIANKKTNLLFFGNFHRMGLDDYNWAMNEMLGDKFYLYNSMIKDNYFLGIVLAKKYRYLRIAYNIFMFGLIISMIAFFIGFMLPDVTEVY
jgi:predicted metal-dependent HD superfamily phosphohydrolase